MAEESDKLRLTVKTTKEKIEVEVATDATAKQLKEHLAEKKSNFVVGQLCLIFAGRILKDEETLESQGVKSGVTIHLVVRSGGGQSRAQQSPSSSAPSSTAHGGGAESSTTGLGMGLGVGGGGGGGDLQTQMMQAQQQLMSNPELMQQLMESPLMQNLLANPDTLQSMLTSNPQIQQLMERNPELTHVLHNPELMRQAMEMARNPAAMREMMRSQDRQLSNIESIPGGFNALARMYHEIQEPMMDAAQESIQQQMQNNPFSALFSQQQGTPNPGPSTPQGTPNTAPLPNPWASGSASSTPRTTGTTSSRTVPTTTTTTATSSSSGSGGGGVASQSGQGFQQQMMQQAMSNPEMMTQLMQLQSQMQQGQGSGGLGMPDPQTMASLMQNPMYQQMMQQVMSNPQLMEQMMRSHPLFANNPQAAEMARQSAQLMQREEFRQMMTNPEALSAMMQIQQGMRRLQTTSPNIFSQQSGSMPPPPPPSSQPSSGNQATGVTPDMLQQILSQITPPTTAASQSPQSATAADPSGVAPSPLSQQQQAEVVYRSQLEQLANMGFSDRQRNITALIETGGDLNAAVNRLIQ